VIIMSRNRINKKSRQRLALESQNHLAMIISDGSNDLRLRQSAAQHMVKISTRHNLSLPDEHRQWLCKKCHRALIPPLSARVRIRGGMRCMTCLSCGEVRRFGAGPKHPRRDKDE
jgi:RNase P subunit RPR2